MKQTETLRTHTAHGHRERSIAPACSEVIGCFIPPRWFWIPFCLINRRVLESAFCTSTGRCGQEGARAGPLVMGGCDAGPAGCPLHGQGNGSGDGARASGGRHQPCFLPGAASRPPSPAAGKSSVSQTGAGEVLAPASSTQLAHTHMQRAGNSVTNPWTVVSALVFIFPLSIWPSALKAALHRIPLPIVLRQWFHRRRPKAAPLWL